MISHAVFLHSVFTESFKNFVVLVSPRLPQFRMPKHRICQCKNLHASSSSHVHFCQVSLGGYPQAPMQLRGFGRVMGEISADDTRFRSFGSRHCDVDSSRGFGRSCALSSITAYS